MSIEESIYDYLKTLGDDIFPVCYLEKATVLLSGSAGWGIPEGSDNKADWDIHIIFQDKDYERFIERFGKEHLIDDHDHNPKVFGQIKSQSWLKKRLVSDDPKWWPLYLWIYTNGKWVVDNSNVMHLVKEATLRFDNELEKLLEKYFVNFCVLKCDVKSSSVRGNDFAAQLYQSNCIQTALETFSLARGKCYPYRKWLEKHILRLDGGEKLIEACKESMNTFNDVMNRNKKLKIIEQILIEAIQKEPNDRLWLHKWWIYNDN